MVCICICASVIKGKLVYVPPQISWSWRQPGALLLHAQALEGQPQGFPGGSVGEAQLSVDWDCVKLLSQTLQSPDTQAPRKKYLWVQTCYIQVDNQPSSSDRKNCRSVPALYPPFPMLSRPAQPWLRSPTSTDSCHLHSLLLSYSVPPRSGHTGFLAAFWT